MVVMCVCVYACVYAHVGDETSGVQAIEKKRKLAHQLDLET